MKYRNFYQRYFEDFQEEKVPDAKGKMRIKRIYTGFYYESALSKRERVGIRLLYAVCYILSFLLFFYGVSRRIPCNSVWYCGFVSGLALIAYLLLLVPLISYICKRERLTAYEYRASSGSLMKIGKWTSLLLLFLAMLMGIHILSLGATQQRVRQLAAAVSVGLSALFVAEIILIEKRVCYMQIHNPQGKDCETHE